MIRIIAVEAMPAQLACRVLGASESGYHAWRGRPPSQRAIRHAWLTDLITEIHVASRAAYGARRVHAELVLGRGIPVGRDRVARTMRRAGLAGLPARRRFPGAVARAERGRPGGPRLLRQPAGCPLDRRHHRAPHARSMSRSPWNFGRRSADVTTQGRG